MRWSNVTQNPYGYFVEMGRASDAQARDLTQQNARVFVLDVIRRQYLHNSSRSYGDASDLARSARWTDRSNTSLGNKTFRVVGNLLVSRIVLHPLGLFLDPGKLIS